MVKPLTRFPVSLVRFALHLFLAPCVLSLVSSCAQQGQLTGGAKDEKPPEVVTSTPANFTKRFQADRIVITFNEYFALKDIGKQLVVSPPMARKPEFKSRGKSLEILFKDTLLPDRTYAINFGDALVDLNEGNPIKNFQFVFATGDNIDSLEAGGQVRQALDGKPAEDVLVMLYSGNADSLPLKSVPLYISRTDKEGKFTLRNLAGGSYKIFALKDGNTNYLFDQPAEAVAFLDSLITPRVEAAQVPDSVQPVKDSAAAVTDTLKMIRDTLAPKPKFIFRPDNILLNLFTEIKPNQYLSSADRPRKDQIRLKFNEKIDSLHFDFLNLPMDSVSVSLEWQGDTDTLDFWIMNRSIASRDSMTAILVYPGYDSIERPISRTDTVKLRYRAVAKPATAQKNDFTTAVSVEKTKILEYGQPVIFTTSLPFTRMDTSFIRLVSGKDSTARKVPYHLFQDTLKGLVINGLPIIQVHPRILKMSAGFTADTLYRLTLLPGAITGMEDQKNDSIDIRFKMKNRDQYGIAKITLPDLKEPAIVQLIDSRNAVAAARLLDGPGTAVFDLVAPGKYTARLIFDMNRNGRWDTGRYIRHIQPEKVISFAKELNLKANWEVNEVWQWEDL